MKKVPLDIEHIHALHENGKLDEAKEGYLNFLKTEPHNTEAIHALGILHAQQGLLGEAIDYFQIAIELQPANPTFYLHLGNALKVTGMFDEAIQVLEKAIELNPNYTAALNNLGTVYYAQKNYRESIGYFEAAIKQDSQYIEAFYNLGLAWIKKGKFNEAIDVYQKLLSISPDNTAGNFQLGCLYLEEGKAKEALNHFVVVADKHPHHFETQFNLGTTYLKLGVLNQAKTHYCNALELVPGDTQVLFNLGVIYMQQGLTDLAIQHYQRALQIDADYFEAHNNIGVAFLAKNHVGYALHHFKEALRIEPNNKAIAYTIQMLSQDTRLRTSHPDYIRNLFDAYADHYEPHLLQSLEYKVPALLFSAIQKVVKPITSSWDILDIGCGTGLCGTPLKSLAKKLIGIDLSANMLARAKEKHTYDELIATEIDAYLTEHTQAFDLMVAGDVFVYTGDLQPTFKAAFSALRAGGYFAFNTEITETNEFIMNQSGRFSHGKNYLEKLAMTIGFSVIFYQQVITRQQNNEPVLGHLFVLQKP